MHRGIFIHSVYVDPDSKKDKQATFVRSEYTLLFSSMTFVGLHPSPTNQYGNVDEQVELVARQLKDIPLLSDGFDAIGFSQGSYCTESRISGTRC
jgi:palmitoyl-protein thioesterase